ncbi:MAG: response regulator [Candidatus Omnitrophica bacterium]|nr:response regulator [Candidatus Omnitrophota bacterium]
MDTSAFVGKHILVVDDDAPCRQLLEIMFEDTGCTLAFALNGQEAVDMVRAGKFDIVLMDVRMPVMKGYEAAAEIRKTHKDLPIIALTAHVMAAVEEKCWESGMNDYLRKPFDHDVLMEMLIKWVGRTDRALSELPLDLPPSHF